MAIPIFLLFLCLSLVSAICYPVSEDAEVILHEADRLSDLFNWADARPLYAEAEKLFAATADERNSLYARIGRIRGEMETLNLPDTSDYLGRQLQSPLVQNDLRLKLMCLIAKGDIDGEIDSGPQVLTGRRRLPSRRSLGTRSGNRELQQN